MENKRVNDMTYKFYKDDGKDKCLRLPHIPKNFVPQNMFMNEKKIGFISVNHKKLKNETKDLSARVLQADLRTGKILRTYSLNGSGNRGLLKKVESVSLFDSETKFIVPTGNSLCVFDRKNAKKDYAGVYQAKLLSCQEQYTSSKGRFSTSNLSLNHNRQNYFWTVFKSDKGSKIYGYKIVDGKILKKNSYSFALPAKYLDSIKTIKTFSVIPSQNKYSFLIASGKGKLAYQLNFERKVENDGVEKFDEDYQLASVDKFNESNRLPAARKIALPSSEESDSERFLNIDDVYSNVNSPIYDPSFVGG
jgi:hypothetical protein